MAPDDPNPRTGFKPARPFGDDDICNPLTPGKGRHHLYISYACPFSHRAHLMVNLLSLHDYVSVSSVAPVRDDRGWVFDADWPDDVNGVSALRDLFPDTGNGAPRRVSVPVLWDRWENQVTHTGSADIAMQFAEHFASVSPTPEELVPSHLRDDIERMNVWLHTEVNRPPYQAGFAQDQQTYEKFARRLFETLDGLDARLAQQPWLHGNAMTLSDLFLFPTLVRFEPVYQTHFKLNVHPLSCYQHLYRYMQRMLADDRIRETVDVDYSKRHYFETHTQINPNGIVPLGPPLPWGV
ncbi:glutathione S-transferase C-terminal domain-containing protein [Halomonadaceae bacterium KBTZ08]